MNKLKIVVLASVLAGGGLAARAQTEVPPPMPAYQPLSDAQLDQLLGPIALYPDPLLAEILPASTLPAQIVLADRYLSSGGDPSQVDQQPWDPNVQALAHYPNVLQWLDENLDWTTAVGEAFLNQQQDVMDSIQRLRNSACNLGNLASTPQEQVVNDDGDVEILPANPDDIYVPDYQPDEIFYQGGYACTFGVALPIGIWLCGDFDWHHHNLILWSHEHPRPANWWHQRPDQRAAVLASHTAVWHPANRTVNAGTMRGDRGWGTAQNQMSVTTIGRSPSDFARAPRTPAPAVRQEAPATRTEAPISRPSMPVTRSAPPQVERNVRVNNPPSTGAFIGIQSAQEARADSERGEQSVRTVSHTESAPRTEAPPAPRAAPSTGGGNAGGGGGSSRGR
jgi:hypothetical protein